MSLCTVCGRVYCDHTPEERGQTVDEMMRALTDEELSVCESEPSDSPVKIELAKRNTIDPKCRPPKEDTLKCLRCGHEEPWRRDEEYDVQSTCTRCGEQMMGRWWGGWKRTVHEERECRKHWREIEAERKRREAEPVSQESEPIENFTKEERRIHNVLTFTEFGQEAPWLGPFGSCLVKIYGIRRVDDDSVEFGIGNEEPPILGWVSAKDFYDEWPL